MDEAHSTCHPSVVMQLTTLKYGQLEKGSSVFPPSLHLMRCPTCQFQFAFKEGCTVFFLTHYQTTNKFYLFDFKALRGDKFIQAQMIKFVPE